LLERHQEAAEAAKPVAAWLREQFERMLAEEQPNGRMAPETES